MKCFRHPQPGSHYTPEVNRTPALHRFRKYYGSKTTINLKCCHFIIIHVHHITLHFLFAFPLALSALICANAASTMVLTVSDASVTNFQLGEPYSEDSFWDTVHCPALCSDIHDNMDHRRSTRQRYQANLESAIFLALVLEVVSAIDSLENQGPPEERAMRPLTASSEQPP